MLAGGNIASLTPETNMHFTSSKECLQKIMCSYPTSIFHLMTLQSSPSKRCKFCPGLIAIREYLMVYDENQSQAYSLSNGQE